MDKQLLINFNPTPAGPVPPFAGFVEWKSKQVPLPVAPTSAPKREPHGYYDQMAQLQRRLDRCRAMFQ